MEKYSTPLVGGFVPSRVALAPKWRSICISPSSGRSLVVLLGTPFALSLGACGAGSGSAPLPTGVSVPGPTAAPPAGTTPAPAPAPSPAPTPASATDLVIPPQPTVPRRSSEDDGEYRANYMASEYVDALYALNNGWDGTGVLVGVLHEGVEETSELAEQISDLSRDFGGVREGGVLTPHASLGGANSEHGTQVATIIAGRNDGAGTQGFAPGARIVVLRTDVQNHDSGTENVGGRSHDALRYAGENGVLIVNRSISKSNPNIANRLMQEAVADYRKMGGLVINAAGNSGGANPNDAIDMTAENAEGWLFVVALDPNGTGYDLASYSNRCGTAMDRCVAGVGTSITTDNVGNIVSFSGTSAAAPQVASLAALILQKWSHLSGVGLRFAYDRPMGDLRIGISARSGDMGDIRSFGMASWLARDRTSFKLGLLDEQGSIFGTPTGSGALRLGDGARTVFVELSSERSIGVWDVEGYASLGTTWIKLAPDALLTDASTISTARFGVNVSRDAFGGRIRFGLAQPLVAIAGAGSVTFGSGYDAASRSLSFTSREIDLSGRISPTIAVGFERRGTRSTTSAAVTSNADGSDATAIASWRIWFR